MSRATAYRYFPTADVLLGEAAVHAGTSPVSDAHLLDTTSDPVERVGRLTRALAQFTFANLPVLRTSLRLSLDPASSYERPGHRRRWIATALAPLADRLDADTLHRLSAALTLVLGIDPIVTLTDITHLDRDTAIDVLEWTARTLVEAVLPDSPATAAEPESSHASLPSEPAGSTSLRAT